jgi:hypothetical protein
MTVYIVKKENELSIYQIQDEQKKAFLAEYGDKILLSSSCVQGAMIQYGDLLKGLEASREVSSH